MAKKKDTTTYVDTKAPPTFTKGTIYIGMNETLEVLPQTQAKRKARAESRGFLFLPLTMAFCVLVGGLAYAAVRFGRFRFMAEQGLPAETDTTIWLQNGGAAAGLAVVLAIILGLRSPFRLLCVLGGVALAMAGFHNLVHLYPEAFAQVFSPEWVSRLRLSAPNESWLYMGQFKPF
jgi:hypothetical protein